MLTVVNFVGTILTISSTSLTVMPTIETLAKLFTASTHLSTRQQNVLNALVGSTKTAEQIETELNIGGTVLRSIVHELRQGIDTFFNSLQGRRQLQRLSIEIEKHFYILKAIRNPCAIEQFWAAHASGGNVLVVWAEPLVFFDAKNRAYIRYLDINDVSEIRTLKKNHPARKLIPCFGYQSSGIVESVSELRRALPLVSGLDTEASSTRDTARTIVFEREAVILGNARMNPYVREFEESMWFQVKKECVIIRNPKARQTESEFEDYAPQQENEEGVTHVVLTRMHNRQADRAITCISSNHGRAVERVVDFVLNSRREGTSAVSSMEELWIGMMNGADRESWPSTFQVLFEIKVVRKSGLSFFQSAKPIRFKEY